MVDQKLNIWEDTEYIKKSHSGSLDLDHYGMKVLKKLAKDSDSICDLGCGDGTRLAMLAKGGTACGVDISESAIRMAKKKHTKIFFIKSSLSSIDLPESNYDLVYSAFVLEHLAEPEKMLEGAIRILKSGGHLVLIAPNYGAPNRASPCYEGSRIKKICQGFINDLFRLLDKKGNLNWEFVKPRILEHDYEIDYDTQVEPYILSLIGFLSKRGLVCREWNSCWSEELNGASVLQKILRVLAEIGVYPFTFWGPHLVVIFKKA